MQEESHEQLVASLNDPEVLKSYKTKYDNYRVGTLPRILGKMLVWCGNVFYGFEPSYEKFKAVEVIARIPYQSWEVASYTLLTAMYSNEHRAVIWSRSSMFSRVAQDNETMHVVVLSHIVRGMGGDGFFRGTLIPLLFSLFYFWSVFVLYIVSPRSALELNYMFEGHAFEQYDRFLELHADELKAKPVKSEYLDFYGRKANNEYELFTSIRNDEIIHRNASIEEIEKYDAERARW